MYLILSKKQEESLLGVKRLSSPLNSIKCMYLQDIEMELLLLIRFVFIMKFV